jgi:hypothetical protein
MPATLNPDLIRQLVGSFPAAGEWKLSSWLDYSPHAISAFCFRPFCFSSPLHSFGDMAKALNRSPVYLSGLQKRFELPTFEGAAYSNAYVTFLRNVIALRTFNISEETLLDLWQLEKKLLQLLHVDSTGSPTWFLDSCGAITRRDRRLLLSNYDLGIALDAQALQPGLNFAETPAELFAGTEMGEDALRVLNAYLPEHHRIRAALADELPHVRTATHWITTITKPHRRT